MTTSPSTYPSKPWRVLVIAGGVELALLGALGWWPGATFPWMGLLIFGGAFAAYAVGASQILQTRGGRLYIWGIAIAMRLILLPLTPELSDDIYRYLWDGEVQLAGINPYRYAPAASELSEIRTVYKGLINNPTVPTIYPPLAQLAFLAIALAGGAATFTVGTFDERSDRLVGERAMVVDALSVGASEGVLRAGVVLGFEAARCDGCDCEGRSVGAEVGCLLVDGLGALRFATDGASTARRDLDGDAFWVLAKTGRTSIFC